jgi:membrane dipeptidase
MILRRRFLSAAVRTGAVMAAGPMCGIAFGDEVDAQAARVVAGTIGVDMHNHVYPAGTEPRPQGGVVPQRPAEQQEAELSIAGELKRSGLTAVCASFVMDFAPNLKPGDARENYLHWLSAIDAELKNGSMHRAMNLHDLQQANRDRQPTIVQSVEGAHFIEGRLERVEEVYQRGLRHLQLLHDKDDMVAPLGDTNTGNAHLGGLTELGAKVVKECNRLGIVVDLAHASHETVMGALRVTTQPVIVSHTNLDSWTGSNPRMAQMMRPRLISKEHAKVVADAGGVVGVWTKLTDSPTEFVQSIKMMVDAIGIDYVGIGSDNDLLSRRTGAGTNRAWGTLKSGFFYAVAGEMLRQGFTAGEIGKVGGGNYCRVFGKVTGSAG